MRKMTSRFLLMLLFWIGSCAFISAQRDERRIDIRQAIVGRWRVELGREPHDVGVLDGYVVTDYGERQGKLEIIDQTHIMVIFRGQERRFEIRFESREVIMVRNLMDDRTGWVRCVRVGG
jgi:hypothetical protein